MATENSCLALNVNLTKAADANKPECLAQHNFTSLAGPKGYMKINLIHHDATISAAIALIVVGAIIILIFVGLALYSAWLSSQPAPTGVNKKGKKKTRLANFLLGNPASQADDDGDDTTEYGEDGFYAETVKMLIGFMCLIGADCVVFGIAMIAVPAFKPCFSVFILVSVAPKVIAWYWKSKTAAPVEGTSNLWKSDQVKCIAPLFVKQLPNTPGVYVDNGHPMYEMLTNQIQMSTQCTWRVEEVVTGGIRPQAKLIAVDAPVNMSVIISFENYKVLQLCLEGDDELLSITPFNIYENLAYGTTFVGFIFLAQVLLIVFFVQQFYKNLDNEHKGVCVQFSAILPAVFVQLAATLQVQGPTSTRSQERILGLFVSNAPRLMSVACWDMVWYCGSGGGIAESQYYLPFSRCMVWIRMLMHVIVDVIFKPIVLLGTAVYLSLLGDAPMDFVKDAFVLVVITQIDSVSLYNSGEETLFLRKHNPDENDGCAE